MLADSGCKFNLNFDGGGVKNSDPNVSYPNDLKVKLR